MDKTIHVQNMIEFDKDDTHIDNLSEQDIKHA